jgi:hypothetical protein
VDTHDRWWAMNRTIAARPLRLVVGIGLVALVFAAVVGGVELVVESAEVAVLLPFVAAAVSMVGLAIVLPRFDRLVTGIAHQPSTTSYSTTAKPAADVQAGSLEQALTDLARVLAEGTRAQCAVVWLAVAQELVSAACHPGTKGARPRTIANLATLLSQPDVDHIVPVLDGSVLRAALTIAKPGRAVTPGDQRFMQDVAYGAGLLLRGAQLNSELQERVRRADDLAVQLQASRQRLTRARDVERQRQIGELTQLTTARLAALRAEVATAQQHLCGEPADTEHAKQSLTRARTGLDELLDRFRVIVRGVYPAVLRGQGPYGALDELATDLPRPVRLSGTLSRRLPWELESGIYWLAASAMQQLAGQPAEQPLRVHLEHTEGRLAVRIDDPALAVTAEEVFTALTDDVDRLAALGGDMEITEDGAGGITLRAWLPDQLEPSVEVP